jgi:hypothetical protein
VTLFGKIITKNLTNTNENTNKNFLLVDFDEFYRRTFSSLYPSVNTNGNILLVYIKGIAMGKEGKKKLIVTNFLNWTSLELKSF